MDTKWYWCLHCNRVWQTEKEPGKCFYPDCDGQSIDVWEWGQVKESNPDYPEIPKEGNCYSLYGENAKGG